MTVTEKKRSYFYKLRKVNCCVSFVSLNLQKLELQKNVSEACNISQSTMIDLEATNKSLEEMRNKYRLL